MKAPAHPNLAGVVVFILWVSVALFVVGCATRDSNPLTVTTGSTISTLAPTTGARVLLSVRLDGFDGRPSVVTSSGSTPPTVTAVLVTFDYAAVPPAMTTVATTMPVSIDGVATASFSNLPIRPTLARVVVNGGTISTYSRFRGGADLVAGSNAIVVNPESSAFQGDLVGYALEKIVSSAGYLTQVRTGLVAAIRARTSVLQGRSPSSAYSDVDANLPVILAALSSTGIGTGSGTGVGTGTGSGSGTGTGTGTGVALTADQLLTAQLIGTWKMSYITFSLTGQLRQVVPNSLGQITTITFNADGLGMSVDYSRYTSTQMTYYQTKETTGVVTYASWFISNGRMVSTSSEGTFTNSVAIQGNTLTQTSMDGEVALWTRVS